MRASARARATRWPRPLERADYDAARAAFVERMAATGDVQAVYQMGSVGAPGLSDLDLIVVCNDVMRGDVHRAADIATGGPTARYVFMHGQFLVPRSVFERLEWVFVGSDVRHLWGERIERCAPLPDEARALRLVFNVEMILSALSRLVRLRDPGTPFPVRPALAVLHGVRFNLALARDWIAGASDLPARVDALRADWFDLDEAAAWERIQALAGDAVGALGTLLNRLRPAAGTYCDPAKGTVRALEVHEVQRYGPWPLGIATRRSRAPWPASLRRAPRLAPHLLPLLELRVPSAYFGFFALEAEAFRRRGALQLARRVRGAAPARADDTLRRVLDCRVAQVVALHDFARRNRLRRTSFPVPLLWQRPFPWKYRVKARLLEAVGVASLGSV